MTTNTNDGEAPNRPAPVELWDRKTVLAFFGGSKPINVSTLYKGMASGRYPKPVNVGPNTVRWIAGECRSTLQPHGHRTRWSQTADAPGRPPPAPHRQRLKSCANQLVGQAP